MRRRKMSQDEGSFLTQALLEQDNVQRSDAAVGVDATIQQQPSHPGALPFPISFHAFVQYILAWWSKAKSAVRSCLETLFPWFIHQSAELSLIQAEQVEWLQESVAEPFDSNNPAHQDMLQQLWALAFPKTECPPSLKSEQWKDMGWQGVDPATDFRGAGFFGLCNLVYFGKEHAPEFEQLLHKKDGARASWEYPFAVCGLNITFMLADVLGLQDRTTEPPKSAAGRGFLQMLAADDHAFEEVYCATFQLLDRNWLDMKATYMEFNQVMKKTRAQLEKALSSRPGTVERLRKQFGLRPTAPRSLL